MPIFEWEGTRYNVKEEDVEKFASKYPESTTIEEREGKKYRIKSKDYQAFKDRFDNGVKEVPHVDFSQGLPPIKSSLELPREDSQSHRNMFRGINRLPSLEAQLTKGIREGMYRQIEEQEKPISGFLEGVEQGGSQLKRGLQYFGGELANLVTGSSEDDKAILDNWDKVVDYYNSMQTPKEQRIAIAREYMLAGKAPKLVEKSKQEKLLSQAEYLGKLVKETGSIENAKKEIERRSKDMSWGDKQRESARQVMNNYRPTEGWGWFGETGVQIVPAVASIAASLYTKNPRLASWIGKGIGHAGMAGMSLSTAGSSMKEARDAGATNGEVWGVGLANAGIEYITEKIPFDRYTGKLFNRAGKKIGAELSQEVMANGPVRQELGILLSKANKKLGGKLFGKKNVKEYLSNIVAEGASEFTAEALQTITPMIYKNPEEYPTLSEIIANGWEGAKAGLFMGSVIGGTSKIAEHKQNKSRRKSQGYVDVAEFNKDGESVIGEVVGIDVDAGKFEILHDGKLSSVSKEDITDGHRFSYEEFVKGQIDKLQTEKEIIKEAEQTSNSPLVHRDSGMIEEAIMKTGDRKVYIIKGRVVPYSDGNGVDASESDESIIVYDAERGTQEQISPEALLSVSAPISPEEITSGSSEVAEIDSYISSLEEETSEAEENEAEEPISVVDRVPRDERGNLLYEQVDSDTAWDAIIEQTEGDEIMAQTVADSMVADKEAALKKLEKSKPKGGVSIEEKIASEKEHKAAIERARQELEAWKNIAFTATRRSNEIEAKERRLAEEAAQRRKVEEERLRAEREEAERIERESLMGVPDILDDKPQAARARGFRRVSGHKIDRQAPIKGLQGKEISVKFSDDAIANGRVAVIEVQQLQPSHIDGHRNPLHFIDEAQPKERNDEASVMSARKIAGNIRPEEITSSVTAYTGAPTVNSRGEAIQGNNRSTALRQMWEEHQEEANKYKQYLIDHAEDFGFNADDVAAMERPVLVNMLDVEDTEAIKLGQYVAQDTESGGTERIKPKNAVQRMGSDMRKFANILLSTNEEDISFAGLIDKNGEDVLRWMSEQGYINPTQYKSAFDSRGNLTSETKNDLRGIMYQSIFQGGNSRLEEMFNLMPIKAQRAILATAFRDYDSPNSERMIEEIQNSIRAYYALSQSADFVNAKNYKEARVAVDGWKIQYQIDDVTGEGYLPADNFSNFALLLATMYKGENQSIIQGTFNKLYDLIQGTQEETLFDHPDNTPRTLVQAIYETLNITYDGQRRSNVLVGDSSASQRGHQGSTGDAATGERVENGEQTADSAGSIDGDSRGIRTEPEDRGNQEKKTDIPQTKEVIGRSLTADEAEDFIADMEENANTAPDVELTIENWDALFGEEGKVITPIGEVKMGENQFTKLMRQGRDGKLGMIKPTLEQPHAIVEDESEAKEDDVTERASSYVFIRSFKKADGSRYYYFTSVTVSKDGKEVVISNQEKRRKAIANLLINGKLVWKHADDVSTASDVADGLYSSQGNLSDPTTEGTVAPQTNISDSKDTTIYQNNNELGEKSAVPSVQEQIQAAEAEVNINPTEAQKEAGNYKKGHVQIGTFNVTIEQPKGSVRSGVDANGNKWETEMKNTYGYIRGTEGVDGDHIDVFLSDDIDGWNGRQVFVVDQYNEDGSFDEHKVMLGFNDIDEADTAYLNNYEKDWADKRKIVIRPANIEDFEKWIASSHRKTKPFAEYKSVKTTEGEKEIQHLVTDAVIKSLTDSGIEVVNATDEMAEAVLGMVKPDIKLMAVEEAKRRADAIESLIPIDVITNTKTKEELNEDYRNLPSVKKDGRMIEFYNSAFKKIYKEGGLFAQVVPQLDEILKQSVLAYSENDNLGGIMRPDGTTHKEHPNVTQFLNYVGKVDINGKEYYVRTTVQEEKSGQTGTHAYMVTEVSLYENTTEGLSLPITTRARGTFDGVIDTKLQQFFDYANGKLNNPEFHIVYHGSAAKFEAFDHRHMGEGEGAQAYGWGTYVTEVEGISKWYANKGSRRGLHITYDGEPFGDILDNMFDGVWQLWKRYIFEATTTEDLKERINSLFIDDSLASPQSKWRKEVDRQKKELLAHIDNGRIKVGAVRQLYTVEIPDDTGSNYLNWDAQVKSEQAERINAGLQEIEETLNGYESDDVRLMYERSGEQIYNRLKMLLGGDKAASEFLALAGFAGIKYPAQFRSGGKSDGKSNYVIFNETDANIVSRVEFLRTPQGTIYGWTDGKKIYLTKDGMNPETPIHEYTHIWAKAMQQGNPDGWQSIKELLRGTPIWDEVINDPNYADIRNYEDAVASEALSRMSGRENARRMEQEARRMIDDAQGIFEKAEATTLVERMRKALREFWNWVGKSLFGIKSFGSIEEVTDRVLWDLIHNSQLNVESSQSFPIEKQIIGERGAASLDRSEEATHRMDNLAVARKMEAEFAEKKQRIEKLKASKPIEITGQEVEPSEDIKQYKQNALEYGKSLRGEYVNADTGVTVTIGKSGIKEVLNHDYKNIEQLQSVAAIPHIIENAIYIDSAENEDISKNKEVSRYHYYVCGLKIGGVDYTVRAVIAEQPNGNRYYDHKLTQIEKGTLLESLSGITTPGFNQETHPVSNVKDKRLGSILQTNDAENSKRIRMATGWERGADGKWRYEIKDKKLNKGWEKKADRVTGVRLSEVIDNKELFDAYPELADVYVSREKLDECNGDWDVRRKVIRVDTGLSNSQSRRTLVHEIQHAIQDIEGFALGTHWMNYMNIYLHPADVQQMAFIRREADELIKKGKYKNLRNAIKSIVRNYLDSGFFNTAVIEQYDLNNSIVNYVDDIASYSAEELEKEAWNNHTAKDKYMRTAGEVEARNASARIGMTPEKRKKTLLSETEEVAHEDQIFLFGNGRKSKMDTSVEVAENTDSRYIADNLSNTDEDDDTLYRSDDTMYRIREEAAPKNTGIGYKVFVLKNGELYPPMVANPNGEATPVGVWLDADAAPIAGQSKTGRSQVKAGGKGTQGGSGKLAYRPGWHLGEIPYALQFNRNDENGERTLFPANFVWAEVEYANDVDYQEEAMSYGYNQNGNFQHSYAGLPRVPENGAYHYRTNPNPETDPWIITGAMRVKRILTPTEVDEMVKAAGREPQRRQEGAITDEQIVALNAEIANDYREGDGAYTDDEVSFENDPVSKVLGKPRGTRKQRREFAQRERQRMAERVERLAKKLHLDNVEVVTDASTLTSSNQLPINQSSKLVGVRSIAELEGKKQRAKGFYTKSTGKITIVIPNHSSAFDVEQTLLHEAVAHYGLRQLFGEHFDTFLDNVFNNAEKSISQQIESIRKNLYRKYVENAIKGVTSVFEQAEIIANLSKTEKDFTHTATEEYLASLAETTDFENTSARWWRKIKDLFFEMLEKIGFGNFSGVTMSDNELRYILWRSYENLREPGRHRSIFGEAADVVKQWELGVGQYESATGQLRVAEVEASAPSAMTNIEAVNKRFNEQLENLTEANAQSVIFNLGNPSELLIGAGISNKPIRLYGNKVIKKMKKHGFTSSDIKDLPIAINNPIAVFNNYKINGNRAILTELRTKQGNILVTISWGKGTDVELNIVSSVFGKGNINIIDWINKGYATFIDKEKALNYLRISAPIAEAQNNQELVLATKIVKEFENHNKEEGTVHIDKLLSEYHQTFKGAHPTIIILKDKADLYEYAVSEGASEADAEEFSEQFIKEKSIGGYDPETIKIVIFAWNKGNYYATLFHEHVHYAIEQSGGIKHFETLVKELKELDPRLLHKVSQLYQEQEIDEEILTYSLETALYGEAFEDLSKVLSSEGQKLLEEILDKIGYEGRRNYGKEVASYEPDSNRVHLENKQSRTRRRIGERGGRMVRGGNQVGSEVEIPNGQSVRQTDETSGEDTGSEDNGLLSKIHQRRGEFKTKRGSEEKGDDVLYREGEPEVRERVQARERYERRVKRGLFQSQEAIQDSMLSLKEAMESILGRKVYIEDVAGYENAYIGENRLSSVNKAECDGIAQLVFKPMLEEVAKLAHNEAERLELIDYMMAKHGLERNEDMREQAKQNGKTADRDFAGLTALTGTKDVFEAEVEAEHMVIDYEKTHDTSELWKKVKAVSKAILQKSYESGLISKETYDELSNRYEYYIPLRGFDEKTSNESYAYLSHKDSAFNAPIKKARGRSSKADDPFANLESMAESTIMQGNRNRLVKQRFFDFVMNHPSDLVSVSELWLSYNEAKDEWEPVVADSIREDDSAEEVERKTKEFESRMTQLSKQYPDRYKKGKDAIGIPYRVKDKGNLQEHQVIVKRGGVDYVLTVNGNPRLSQALNGLTNPDNDVSGAIGSFLRLGESLNRRLSAFYTTRNPDFVISNFLRDILYSNSMVWIKESPNYALRFHKNCLEFHPAKMRRLLSKYRRGELNMNDKTEAMFYRFMRNGGETGYVNIRDIERHKHDIKRELRKSQGRVPIEKAWALLGERFDELNRSVENCARFAAFVTSREIGRSIDRAIYDAKEISVNFNKKGSGAKFFRRPGQTTIGNASALVSGFGRSSYVFWNAGIQGSTNFGRQIKRHPAKALTGMATMYLLGSIIAYMGMDDEEDKNAYYNLPEYVRRSNIMFRRGDHWISIPLPIEFRAIYGMGELMMSVMSGKERMTAGELAESIAGQVSQVLPLDFMEGGGGWNAFVPSAAKPIIEAYITERSWTGLPLYKDNPWNEHAPEWTKAYSSANKYLVDLSMALNEASGGDEYRRGWFNFNPSKVEYLLNGYFGGVASTIDKMVKMGETWFGDREYDPRSFLLWNRIVKAGDERTAYRAVNREYYRLLEESEETKRVLRGYEQSTNKGVLEYAEKMDFLYNSAEYGRYEIYKEYQEYIDILEKMLDESSEAEDMKMLEVELNEVKKALINECEKVK